MHTSCMHHLLKKDILCMLTKDILHVGGSKMLSTNSPPELLQLSSVIYLYIVLGLLILLYQFKKLSVDL